MSPLGPGGQQWGGPGGWDQSGQPGPGGWQPGGPGGPGGGGLGRFRRPRGPLVPAVATAALIVVVAAIIVATRGGGSTSDGTTAAGATPTAGPTASASASQSAQPGAAQQQAATRLATLLSQSGNDRGAVDHAYYATQSCKSLSADQQVFARAATNRDTLLSKLGSVPDASALNPTMIQDLTGAWQASAQADTDYAKWAASMAHGCHPNKTMSNGNLKASYGPDATATSDKQAFTKLWNPVAKKDGLPTYQPGDL